MRVEKDLTTLQSIERFACDHHDHVSFAKAWMLMSKGVAHALDYDFGLVPPAVMAAVERRLKGRLRRTISGLLGSAVSELALDRARLTTCFGGLGIRVAQMGFAAQATNWSSVDLHKAFMTTMCEALGSPRQGAHPEEVTALASKADLLTAGVAVDDYAKVMVEHAVDLHKAVMTNICVALNRPIRELHPEIATELAAKTDLLLSWVAVVEHARETMEDKVSNLDKRAAEIVRPALVQTKLQSKILSAAETVHAAKLHSDMPPEQQAIMLSAWEPGTGTYWTAVHKSPTELSQNAQWRMATALRLGAAPDADPRSMCALLKGNDGDICEQSLSALPFYSTFGGARARPRLAVQCTLRKLIEQAGSYADTERHVPELLDWLQKNNEAAPEMRCAISDVVSWFQVVLQQLWIDVSVRCPHAGRYNESVETRGGCSCCGGGENEALWNGFARASLRDLRKTGQ